MINLEFIRESGILITQRSQVHPKLDLPSHQLKALNNWVKSKQLPTVITLVQEDKKWCEGSIWQKGNKVKLVKLYEVYLDQSCNSTTNLMSWRIDMIYAEIVKQQRSSFRAKE